MKIINMSKTEHIFGGMSREDGTVTENVTAWPGVPCEVPGHIPEALIQLYLAVGAFRKSEPVEELALLSENPVEPVEETPLAVAVKKSRR